MTILNFSDTLSVVGILVSGLFGAWGVYLTLRRAKYPASLTFVREQTVALLDDFATRIPNLSVLYKDTPIDKSVVLLSGYLMNDGNIDITPQMTERPLACELPDGCSWLEFKITGATEELNATGEIKSPQVLELNFGLFRRDEVFSFQALAVLSTDYAKKKPAALAEALRWSHRIASLGSIRMIKLPEPTLREFVMLKVGAVIMLLIGCCFVIYEALRKPDSIVSGLLLVLSTVMMIYINFADDYKRYRLRRVFAIAARHSDSILSPTGEAKRVTTVSPQELP